MQRSPWRARPRFAPGSAKDGADTVPAAARIFQWLLLLERVVAARPPAPPIARAAALVDLATLIESDGERERVRDLFQRAAISPAARPWCARSATCVRTAGPMNFF